MTRALEILTDWWSLAAVGADAVTYAAMALLGTTLFILRLVAAMFGDILGEFGLDLEADTDNSFTLFSLLSVMAFIMGTGWMGLACRVDWGLSRPLSVVIAVGFGVLMMVISSGLMYVARSLNKTVTYDLETAVGRTAHVYRTIPERGAGHGQVQVTVSGRLMTIDAVSDAGHLDAFTDALVVGTRDDETLVVTSTDPTAAPAGS